MHGIIHLSRHLKEELVWTTDKWLRFFSNINFMQDSYTTKELKNKVTLRYSMHCFVILSVYSNYFKLNRVISDNVCLC